MEAKIKQTLMKLEQQTHLLKEKDVAIQVYQKDTWNRIIEGLLITDLCNFATQVLQDELSTLQLEFSTTEEKNKRLEKENGELVQRWLKKMNEEAEKMNEATMFYERWELFGWTPDAYLHLLTDFT